MIFANVALGAWGLGLVRNFADLCGKCEFILRLAKVRRGLPPYCTDQAPLFVFGGSKPPPYKVPLRAYRKTPLARPRSGRARGVLLKL